MRRRKSISVAENPSIVWFQLSRTTLPTTKTAENLLLNALAEIILGVPGWKIDLMFESNAVLGAAIDTFMRYESWPGAISLCVTIGAAGPKSRS